LRKFEVCMARARPTAPGIVLSSLYTRSNEAVQVRRRSGAGAASAERRDSHLRSLKDAFIVRFARRSIPV